jgi:hypothetical protein
VSLRSVEPSAGPFAGCLAGLNERGIGVVVTDDRDVRQRPLRALAQDLLMRATELDSALELLACRARYASGSGALRIADGFGRAFQVELRAGALRSQTLAPRSHAIAESTLQLDLRALALVYRTADGSEIRAVGWKRRIGSKSIQRSRSCRACSSARRRATDRPFTRPSRIPSPTDGVGASSDAIMRRGGRKCASRVRMSEASRSMRSTTCLPSTI